MKLIYSAIAALGIASLVLFFSAGNRLSASEAVAQNDTATVSADVTGQGSTSWVPTAFTFHWVLTEQVTGSSNGASGSIDSLAGGVTVGDNVDDGSTSIDSTSGALTATTASVIVKSPNVKLVNILGVPGVPAGALSMKNLDGSTYAAGTAANSQTTLSTSATSLYTDQDLDAGSATTISYGHNGVHQVYLKGSVSSDGQSAISNPADQRLQYIMSM